VPLCVLRGQDSLNLTNEAAEVSSHDPQGSQGAGLRKFFSLKFACTFFLFASFAYAQQTDFAIGGSTVWSSKNKTASEAFLPPAEKGGTYPSFTFQHLNERNFGFSIEGAFRYKEGVYNNFQYFRPIFYDVNGVYSRRLAPKTHGDFIGGVGGETLIFYAPGNCGLNGGGCRAYVNSSHFLMHLEFGIRYYAWRNIFVRPEVHYYFIPNNFQFHSDNVFRYGASVGYTFGTH